MNNEQQLTMDNITTPKEDKLSEILRLAMMQADKESTIKQMEKDLKKLNAELEALKEKLLPDLMTDIGLTELRLADGRHVSIKPEVYANVSKTRANEAFDWLRANNMGGIIKENCIVGADRKEALAAATIPFQLVETIHPATLRSFVKERLEADPNFPRELFGVHEVKTAIIK